MDKYDVYGTIEMVSASYSNFGGFERSRRTRKIETDPYDLDIMELIDEEFDY